MYIEMGDMMVKGFIFFKERKIPFVIENYLMELFTDGSLLDDFCKEYNYKENYILHGQCFDIGIRERKATFLVESSMGGTCYLRCSKAALMSSAWFLLPFNVSSFSAPSTPMMAAAFRPLATAIASFITP